MREPALHQKLGYEYHREMAEIREGLRKNGVGANGGLFDLDFAAQREYMERHKNDPTLRERQAEWARKHTTNSSGKRVFFTEEEAAYVVERLGGTNDPAGHSALQKLLEAFSRPSSPEGR